MDSLRVSDQLRERPALLAVIATDRIRNILIRIVSLGIDQNQRHELPRLLHRQRPEQQFVDLAKNRRVRPNAERKGEHRYGGKAGVLQQLAEGEFEIIHFSVIDVLEQPLDRSWPPGVRAESRRPTPLAEEPRSRQGRSVDQLPS